MDRNALRRQPGAATIYARPPTARSSRSCKTGSIAPSPNRTCRTRPRSGTPTSVGVATTTEQLPECHGGIFSPGYADKGRVERGIERGLFFTEPPDFHIFLLYPQFYRCPATLGNVMVESSRHGYADKGRVERGIERGLYFTEPPDFHIFLLKGRKRD